MRSFVHLIADYGAGDPAFSEVVHRLQAAAAAGAPDDAPPLTVQATEVPPFSTVATGFWIEQLAVHNPPFDDLLVYSNTAPRTEASTPDRPDEGGRLCYLELETGVPVVAVDAGYNLSFVADRARELRVVETPEDAGQFRSRDVFPERVVALATGDTAHLGERLDPEDVPSPPASAVCHVDGYGNVKTTIRASELPPLADPDGPATVTVAVDGVRRSVAVHDAVGDVPEGALALLPGSAGGADPYVELFLRGGAAADAFDDPDPGDDVAIAGG